MEAKERAKAIYRVTWAGSLVNLLLVVFKFIAGVWGHSAAMTADAVHSLSDFATDLVVLLFVRISNKPKDKSHDYGHGKYETLATAVIGILLAMAGIGICWNGIINIKAIWNGNIPEAPNMLALWAAIVSILMKEVVFRYTRRVGIKTESKAVIANAWHHRSDALSSIGTAAGISGAIFWGESWRVLDSIAAVIVSLFIIKVAWTLLKPCIDELTDSSLPDEIEEQIKKTAEEQQGVSAPHNLRTRRIGNHYAIEMHVRMDGHLTLFEAHAKASEIERKLKEKYGAETHVGIHVEPLKNAKGTYDISS